VNLTGGTYLKILISNLNSRKEQNLMEQQNNSKPVKKFRVGGGITSAIFRNEKEVDGQTVIRHSAQIKKQFRKDDGTWQDTNVYFSDDLPKLILVAQKAFEFISLKESKDAEESIPV
jgi:hypothetical protein